MLSPNKSSSYKPLDSKHKCNNKGGLNKENVLTYNLMALMVQSKTIAQADVCRAGQLILASPKKLAKYFHFQLPTQSVRSITKIYHEY